MKRKKRRRLPSADDVLHGRSAVTMEQLFALIHQVNPTDATMPESEKARSYAVKAGLQSLLIERFGSELEVEADAEAGESIIGILHRQSRRDACHARLDELSPEARAWVRLRLDLEAAAAEAETRPGPAAGGPAPHSGIVDGSPEHLLRDGNAAREDYDLDRARARLTEAVRAARLLGSERFVVDSARALLGLLVDQLAENAEALAWRERLPEAALEDPSVRCLLALAAARESDEALAGRLILGLETERVDEVHLELARSALASHDFDRCERELARIPVSSDHSPAAQGVAEELRARRIEASRLLEDRLSDLAAAGDWSRARALARQIVAIHPESETARRTLREFAERERTARAASEARAIENALEADEIDRASRLYRNRESLAVTRPDLEERIRDAARRKQGRMTREAIDAISSAFTGGASGEAVEAYWEANETIRRAVRRRVAERELYWTDELGPAKGRSQCQKAAATAAALARLEQAREPEQIARTLDELASLDASVRGSSEARRLVKRARVELAEHRHDSAVSLLSRAERAAAADLDRACELADAVPQRDLAVSEREALAALRRRIDRANRERSHRDSFEQCLAANDKLGARHEARELAALTEGEEQAAWKAQSERLSAAIRDAWIHDRITGEEVASELQDCDPHMLGSTAHPWLLPGGAELVLAAVHGSWLFVRVLNIDDAQSSRGAAFRTPKELGLCTWQVDGESLWLFGSSGLVLQLDSRSWDVLLWKDLREVEGVDKPRGSCGLVGSRYIWLKDEDTDEPGCVIDVKTWRVVRRLDYFFGESIQGASPARVALALGYSEGMALCDPRGRRIWRDEREFERIAGAVVHPTGNGFLLQIGCCVDHDRGEGWHLALRELRDGQLGSQIDFERSDAELVHAAATSLEHACTYFAYTLGDRTNLRAELVALAASDRGLQELDRVELERVPCLAQDPEGRHVVALVPEPSRLRAIRLERGARALDGVAYFSPRTGSPVHWDLGCCRYPSGAHGSLEPRFATRFWGVSDTAAETLLRSAIAQHRDDPAALLVLLRTYPSGADEAPVHELRALLDPDPPVVLALADRAASARRWGDALGMLDEVDEAALDDHCRQHLHHLLGICFLATGNESHALEELESSASVRADACSLADELVLCRALCEPVEAVLASEASHPVRAVVGAIRRADRGLLAGDLETVVATLDCPLVWQMPDLQLLARLVEAYLGIESDAPRFRFRKRLALAALHASLPHTYRRQLLLGNATWDDDRIDAIARRAHDWLEQSSGTAGEDSRQRE